MKIKIEDLTFKCIIGILKKERRKRQKVVVNVSFTYDFKSNEFIDYSLIASKIEKTMKKEKFLLLEDAIIFLKKMLQKKYPIKKLKISISKPDILKNCKVSVCK